MLLAFNMIATHKQLRISEVNKSIVFRGIAKSLLLLFVATLIAISCSPKNSKEDIIVYQTKTGSKYHKIECTYLWKSKIPISLRDAVQQGLQPCSRCTPEKLSEQESPKNE